MVTAPKMINIPPPISLQHVDLQETLFEETPKPKSFEDDKSCPDRFEALPYVVVPDAWIVKWIDMKKYGLGYVLSNGSVGAHFNDSTKIVEAGDQTFDYISRRVAGTETRSTHTFTSDAASTYLSKKAKLLGHFKAEFDNPRASLDLIQFSGMPSTVQEAEAKSGLPLTSTPSDGKCINISCRYAVSGELIGNFHPHPKDFVWQLHEALMPHVTDVAMDDEETQWTLRAIFDGKALHKHSTLCDAGIVDGAEVYVVKVAPEECLPPFVKKWARKDGAALFQISNKTVQAVFPDATSLVLSAATGVVTQVDKDGEMRSYVLSNIMGTRWHGSSDIVKRLHLVRNMLMGILSPSAAAQGNPC